MKTLAQVEPRTPIASAPFTISVPGSYYLTTNLTTAVSNAITIAVSGVTLDLNGFSIASTVANAANGGYAILLNSGLRNITIANGFVEGGVTNNGSGVYSGSGFGYGISYSGSAPANVLVSRVSVAGCLYSGIYLNTGDSTVVESCTVRTVGGYGICASTIKQSAAIDCGNMAIYGKQVSDCRGQSSGSNSGVYATTALNCSGSSVGGSGIAATTALNCSGSSGSGYGVYALTAQNCYGSCSSSGTGVFAGRTAVGCFGSSSTGTGLSAENAATCTGSRSGGTAIQATIANGCYAASGTNNITYKYNMP